MQRTALLVAAVLAVALASGIPVMPAQAVSPDCTHDYDIPNSEPLTPQALGTTGNVVGRVVVDDSADLTVKVKLESSSSTLNFGVFYDPIVCGDAKDAGLSTCSTAETLTSGQDPVVMDCDLQRADVGEEIRYFFVYENGGSAILSYKDCIA